MLKTNVAGVEFSHPVFNASGPKCITLEELKAIGESGASAITTKSCTKDPREGNPKPRYSDNEFGSINSSGLPNVGYREYAKYVPELKKYGKPVIVSAAGLCWEDNLEIIEELNNTDCDFIELNLSCPNLVGKPQTGYDFEQSDYVIGEALKASKKTLGLKLPPYFDFIHFEQMAGILNKHKPAFVTCINSIGNALFIDPEKEQAMIKPKKGFGGLGGKYIKPTALANVNKFHQLLKGTDIIGVGGIYEGKDVFEFILAGAKAVQIGTVFMQEGHGAFTRIEKEFNEYMAKKGYASIEEARGNLKPL